ncbi:hypothetical protein [Streptomyces sp. NPDC005799]|uniref:hypothetical protein n=1 Tax=Streptomyces sp. NPDC005799 TaxID=3154678 RepID=UPI0033E9B8E4
MDIAALVAWIVTALGGFVLLGRWISGGGLRQQQSRTARFPAPRHTMFARWIPVYRTAPTTVDEPTSAERHLPAPVVAAHGLVAAATLVLVLLAALDIGGSQSPPAGQRIG